MEIKNRIKQVFRSLGYDITTYPQGCSRIEAHLSLLLPRFGINCVLDVGANRGQYGLLLRRLGYKGLIVSFEPVAREYSLLSGIARRDAHWVTLPCALGESDERMTINITDSTDFSSLLTPNAYGESTFGKGSTVVTTEEVQVHRLDGLFDQHVPHGARVYLKMDTQGYDHMVLNGASGCMDKILALQSEMSVRPIYDEAPRYIEGLTRLEQLGFELTGLFPLNRDPELRLIELECVAVRKFKPNNA